MTMGLTGSLKYTEVDALKTFLLERKYPLGIAARWYQFGLMANKNSRLKWLYKGLSRRFTKPK